MADSLPEILKMEEVAKFLRISRAKAYALAKQGKIPCFYVGASPRCRRSDIEKMTTPGYCS